jgi:TolB protein
MTRRTLPLALLAVALLAPLAVAQDRDVIIDTQKGGARRIRIHCESFAPEGDRNARETSVQADEVLAHDLDWSAVFDVSRSWSGNNPAGEPTAVVSGKWRVTGSQIRLAGEVRDLPARRPILVKEYRGNAKDWRRLAHQFADEIVFQFTGENGISETQIAFAAQIGRNKELFVMDYDGAGLRQLTRDGSIALSPAWSPEGSLLLFTSYRSGTGAQIYVQPVAGSKPYLISGRKGLNTSASYSPDGREIACALSMDGNAEVYRLDARGGSPRRLTSNRAIDTSPAWSPTGQEIAFTSDRSGSPQVYVMDREGGNVRRLTYEVDYTDSPAWSPKGDRIAFVSRTGQGFDIYVCRADGSGARLVVGGRSNENPRWSPDGRHLVFASNREGAFRLFVTDLDARPPRRLDTGGQTALSPAWSPRLGSTRSALNLNR